MKNKTIEDQYENKVKIVVNITVRKESHPRGNFVDLLLNLIRNGLTAINTSFRRLRGEARSGTGGGNFPENPQWNLS